MRHSIEGMQNRTERLCESYRFHRSRCGNVPDLLLLLFMKETDYGGFRYTKDRKSIIIRRKKKEGMGHNWNREKRRKV